VGICGISPSVRGSAARTEAPNRCSAAGRNRGKQPTRVCHGMEHRQAWPKGLVRESIHRVAHLQLYEVKATALSRRRLADQPLQVRDVVNRVTRDGRSQTSTCHRPEVFDRGRSHNWQMTSDSQISAHSWAQSMTIGPSSSYTTVYSDLAYWARSYDPTRRSELWLPSPPWLGERE
jgi:hypothetical protein